MKKLTLNINTDPTFGSQEVQPSKLYGKKAFVTGATGFLGSALAKRLAGDGALVRALVRNPERNAPLRDMDGIESIQGDVSDENRMRTVIQGCEIVFHTAGVLNGPMKTQYPVNVGGTRNVMQAAAHAGIERVVHVSSAGAYGFGRRGDISEETPLQPGHAAYGITKAEAEEVVRNIAREHGMEYSILRPGMIYGPGSKVWTEAMFKLARRKPIVFPGAGGGSIPAIHVADVVDLMLVLAVHPGAAGETFNCTPDPSPTWREFLGAYAALAGNDHWLALPIPALRIIARLVAALAPGETRFKDLPQLIEFVTVYRRYRMDKARELLGWQPQIGLRKGIESCASYLREKGLLN